MTVSPRATSRAEARARTREVVLQAAEDLFLSVGYEATTVARIAERAGRTQGAIYSNFTGKDDLGLAVLQRRFLTEATRLSELVDGVHGPEERIDAVSRWWHEVSGQQDLFVLVAEYGLAARRATDDSSPRSVTAYVELVGEFLRTRVSPRFDVGNELDDRDSTARQASTSTAILAVVAMATGLAVCQLFGALDQERSSQILADTVRTHLNRN
jgi:AcrR family transcriptional regulator